jgi:hypothetical protein
MVGAGLFWMIGLGGDNCLPGMGIGVALVGDVLGKYDASSGGKAATGTGADLGGGIESRVDIAFNAFAPARGLARPPPNTCCHFF